MKKKTRILIYSVILMGYHFMLVSSCTKDESSSKNDPIITWENPADIAEGTRLTEIQLNATADVPGTFEYTPPIETILSLGAQQELLVVFTPADYTKYNSVSKTVKINITLDAVFNPNLTYGSLTDIEGNVYKTITIGTQTWMAENLRTTKFKDNIDISNASTIEGKPSYWWYDNDVDSYKDTHNGILYNYYTIMMGKLAPAGWHVPSNAEWSILVNYLMS